MNSKQVFLNLPFAAWLNRNDGWFRVGVFAVSLSPIFNLSIHYYFDELGFNPFDRLMASTGFWSMIYLILTLAITPLRRWLCFLCKVCCCNYGKRLSDWNFLIKSRRMLGLYSFFYLCCHASVYLHFELAWNAAWLLDDMNEKRYLVFGIAGWVISLLLALTSPKKMVRLLGKNWRKLHRLMYLLSILAVLHAYLQAKVGGQLEYVVYAGIVLVLLIYRVLVRYVSKWYRKDDSGLLADRSQQ